MKKAAFIVCEYNEDYFFGGGEKVNYYIIRELLNRNYTVDVYADISYVQESKIVKIIIKDKNFEKNYKNILSCYDLILSTNCAYESDITYSHNHSYPFETMVLISEAHWFFKTLFCANDKRKLKKYKRACKAVLGINKITVSSNIVKSDYLKFFNIPEWKINILPPGVDIREKSINLPDKNCICFGLAARGFISKGGYVTLFAINRLKHKYKNFKVRIINQNAKRNLVIQFLVKMFNIGKYIEFLPLQKDMTDFYKSMDFMLVPSLKEPFGLVATEAMSFSKIPIVSSIAGAADLIEEGQNGFIIDYSNPKQRAKNLYECMKKAIELTDNDYLRLANNACETVKDRSYEKFAQKYIDLAERKNFAANPKVSVIILVNNTEKHILDCIKSVLNQTLYEIEVICVCENLTDNTFSIIEKYSRFDLRIKILKQEKSICDSTARNLGLEYAKGEYIFFIENDAHIDTGYLEKMYNRAKSSNSDAVINELSQNHFIKNKLSEKILL